MNMKKIIIFISFFTLPATVLWLPSEPACDKALFSCYVDWRDNYCRSSESPWNAAQSYPELGKVTLDYVEFSAASQNSQIARIKNEEKGPTEKSKLEKELDMKRIGTFAGYKSVEIARIQYRNNMNKIFSCAVVASRIQSIEKVSELIQKAWSTEISKKLTQDANKLKALSPANCATAQNNNTKIDYASAVVRSATTEYCSYRFYNEYLKAQIDQNRTQTFEIETKIGEWWENMSLPPNMQDYANLFSTYTNQVQSNIARAQTTLPKALVAYREMERTYGVHIMLLIIYDDYIELRQNLSTYLNAVSQLFEKAKNAQSANQK